MQSALVQVSNANLSRPKHRSVPSKPKEAMLNITRCKITAMWSKQTQDESDESKTTVSNKASYLCVFEDHEVCVVVSY